MRKKQSQNTIRYVCVNCGAKEEIPEDIIEYFDEINPEQLMFGSHQFTCENCFDGIMRPEKEPGIIIRGYGLHSGLGDD